jgi:hypothetical protein
MDCEKVRDRFSSLWEKELMPSEERTVKEHLSSCAECWKQWERFEKTMRWLHSAGEVEVPDGFLPGILKKMVEQKRKGLMSEGAIGRWIDKALSWKLPIQAVAMVVIIFLVLYLTQMIPMERYHLKDSNQNSSSLSTEKKSEPLLVQKEGERGSRALQTTPEASQLEKVRQAKAPSLKEKKAEVAHIKEVKEEAKKGVSLPAKVESTRDQPIDLKETAMAKASSPELGKIEKGLALKEKSVGDSKLPREIILAVSDQEKILSKLNELVKQFGGEIITSEKNTFLVSLPIRSFAEFERELRTLSSSGKPGEITLQKKALDDLSFSSRVKEGEMRERDSLTRTVPEKENFIVVRIVLLEE